MGRKPCCAKGVIRGTWSAREDEILVNYIKIHGEGKWRELPRSAGLRRCGKSCRLRWLNYLRPDIKRGNITEDEDELIIRLHKLLGNRWTLIAGRLPGRTDNEIKNYWNTNLSKRVEGHDKKLTKTSEKPIKTTQNQEMHHQPGHEIVGPKAVRCKEAKIFPQLQFWNINHTGLIEDETTLLNPSSNDNHNSSDFLMDFDVDIGEFLLSPHQEKEIDMDNDNCYDEVNTDEIYNADMLAHVEFSNLAMETAKSTGDGTGTWSAEFEPLQENDGWDLEALASFLCTEEVRRG